MARTRITFKSVLTYLATIITWSIFVILVSCVLVLGYYYLSSGTYLSKKDNYKPAFSFYTIVSPSMTPIIKVYDVIINFAVDGPQDIKVGDIITFTSTSAMTYDMTITHRVKDIQIVNGEYQYTTKGDANKISDVSPAEYSKIIGRAKLKLPQLGRVQEFVANQFAWLLVLVIPAVLVIVLESMKSYRINKAKRLANAANKRLVASTEGQSGIDSRPV